MGHDPFFAVGQDFNWNACIGRQSDQESYADGFIEAEVEVINSLFEKELYGKRDTLVLPILYNARHGIELALKMAIGELVGMDVIANAHTKNHDILAHWKHLAEAKLGDELLRHIIGELKPFVVSLSQIDEDGQELRYHQIREGTQSLSGHAVTSLILIRDSLKALHTILCNLKYRVYNLQHERSGGFFTTDLSRRDLIEIAKLLPPKSSWSDSAFDEVKAQVKSRYAIESNKLSNALELIEKNREARALLGLETDLAYLSDGKARFLGSAFLELYPPKENGAEPLIVSFSELHFEDTIGDRARKGSIYQDVIGALTQREIADTRVIFYLGRDDELPETYETRVASDLRGLSNLANLDDEFIHVFSKINFLREFKKGLKTLGKASLAESL